MLHQDGSGPAPLLSVVLPAYDEEAALPVFAGRLRPVVPLSLDTFLQNWPTYSVACDSDEVEVTASQPDLPAPVRSDT